MKFKIICHSLIWFGIVLPFQLLSVEERIPSCLLSYRFGPEQHVIVVEKSSQTMYVFSNYKATPVAQFKITTGKKDGQKSTEGDMKTPEGIYFFKRILSGDELPKVDDYGEKAFTMDYPNPIDRKEARGGSGIWLHGANDPEKTKAANNTKGCVVMANSDLVKVSKYIFLNQTPICVFDKIDYLTVSEIEKRREQAIGFLKDWKTSWENKDLDNYIDFYDQEFMYNNMTLSAYRKHKQILNQRYSFIKVFLSDINLYAINNYFVVVFNQLYISDVNHFYSKKIQYWLQSAEKPRIIDTINYPGPSIKKFEISKGNFISIDEFRRDFKKQIKKNISAFKVQSIVIDHISIMDHYVKVEFKNSSNKNDLRIIPVLLVRENNRSEYRSLDGVVLNNGVPQSYEKGVALFGSYAKEISIPKNEYHKLRSLTVFAVDASNELKQIITYFVEK